MHRSAQQDDPANDVTRTRLLIDAAYVAPSRSQAETRRLLRGYAHRSLGDVERRRWFAVLVGAVTTLRRREATRPALDEARERAELAALVLVFGTACAGVAA